MFDHTGIDYLSKLDGLPSEKPHHTRDFSSLYSRGEIFK